MYLLSEKRSKDLEKVKAKAVMSTMILSRLAESDHAEATAWWSANYEVVDRKLCVQVFVAVAAVSDIPARSII